MTTIKDIAKISGYGVSTVSYALADDPKIPSKTKNKILKVAKDLNYVPNAYARALKNKKIKNIGVFLPGFKGPIHSTLLSGLADIIKVDKSKTKLLVTILDEELLLIYERQVDLAIFIGSSISDEKVIDISKIIPVVLIDKYVEAPNIYNTFIENAKGIENRAFDLYSKGVRKFMYMKGSPKSDHNKERFLGFTTAMNKLGISENNQIVLDADGFSELKGYEIIKKYLENNKITSDALICANDELAIGAMKALKEAGYLIPKDLKVAGFDNIEKDELVTPTLSTIAVDWYKYGVDVAKLSLDILNEVETNKIIRIDSKLINRDSTL